eukprot:4498564-Pyramimonas_sp.AAC.1
MRHMLPSLRAIGRSCGICSPPCVRLAARAAYAPLPAHDWPPGVRRGNVGVSHRGSGGIACFQRRGSATHQVFAERGQNRHRAALRVVELLGNRGELSVGPRPPVTGWLERRDEHHVTLRPQPARRQPAPIRRRKRGYFLTTDQSVAGSAGIYGNPQPPGGQNPKSLSS